MRKLFDFYGVIGIVAGAFLGAVAVFLFWKEEPHKCEFTVPYMVYPALTITCEGPGRTLCDTLYTYSDWGKGK